MSSTHVLCRCDCGSIQPVRKDSLKYNNSCGCLRSELLTRRNTTHGESKTAEYRIWCHILARCNNPSDAAYKHYGGRGIKVCKRWLKFENFLVDMGRRPSIRHSVERQHNDKGYSPSNCIWATQEEQCSNQRRSIRVELDGEIQALKRWSVRVGLPYTTVYMRVRRGWSYPKALGLAV